MPEIGNGPELRAGRTLWSFVFDEYDDISDDWVPAFQDETWWTRLAQPELFAWREGGCAIKVCGLPVKAPWLNRIEPKWAHANAS